MQTRLLPVIATLFFAASVHAQSSALDLLDEVAHHYAHAGSFHIESTQESSHTSEFGSSTQKTVLSAEQVPGGRYRFAGRTNFGQGLAVSDGTTEYVLHYAFGDYTKKAPYSIATPSTGIQDSDAGPIRDAFQLRQGLSSLGSAFKSARFLPRQSLSIAGQTIVCDLVTVTAQDLRNPSPGSDFTYTYWIDTQRLTLRKEIDTYHYVRPYSPGRPVLNPILELRESTTIYTLVELDQLVPASEFAFTPPAYGNLVESFAPPAGVTSASSTAANTPQIAEMVGRPAPTHTYTAADGSTLALNSLRGHPILIDLWATWCGPCLLDMPKLDRLNTQLKGTGLVIVGLDMDKNPDLAPAYLRRQHYSWPDYHITPGEEAYGLPHTGIPLTVLIDTSGTIVYYHTGSDQPGLEAAIRSLGPAYAQALDR